MFPQSSLVQSPRTQAELDLWRSYQELRMKRIKLNPPKMGQELLLYPYVFPVGVKYPIENDKVFRKAPIP